MGALKVKLCDKVIFEKSGDQGNQWNMGQVRLQGTGSKEVSANLGDHYLVKSSYHGFDFCHFLATYFLNNLCTSLDVTIS